ncbi:MAG: carbohydrate porin [Chitinophagaceae bacterium]|jgi:hypothetical protein|nr:carbohydrate porin [Chitinophagaceae bacterium]
MRLGKTINLIIILTIATTTFAQTKDSLNNGWSTHFQATVIGQNHPGFKALYSGENSLADTVEPTAVSLTATLFFGKKLWKGAAFYLNPEVAGGNGLSYAMGVAGALNGETPRVDNVDPKVFIARAYLQQHFPLGNTTYEAVKDDINQVADMVPKNRITITAGKFAISDFFDDNAYSKDPRTQFFNWSLWANGAWDYPANTRGYTYGLVTELVYENWSARLSTVSVSKIANAPAMEYNAHAHSETFEAAKKWSVRNRSGAVRLLLSNTYSRAPSYKDGIKAIADNNTFLLNVFRGFQENNVYGGRKFSIGLNAEQALTDNIGVFGRAGWDDGKHASWAFTEIDQTANVGLSMKGTKWKRPNDVWGIAGVVNGLSKDHKDFLAAGGYGFIIGDGKLNYGHEAIIETYYNAKLTKFLWVTFDYQFVNNPGYNKDRGPVHVFGLRAHVEM